MTNTTSGPGDSEHDRLYKQASALVFPHLPLHGGQHEHPGADLAVQLRHGIRMLERVIEINPRNWPAMWMAGMTYRRLGDLNAAFGLLQQASELCGSNPDVPREAGLTAMDLGRPADAVEYTSRAIRASPDDPGLVANLALAHLFNQDPSEAKRAADYALRSAPADPINRQIVQLVDAVLAGERPCPRSAREI